MRFCEFWLWLGVELVVVVGVCCGGCSCFCMIVVIVIVVNIFDMVVGFFVRLVMVVCVWFGAAVCVCGGGSVVLFCFL